MERSIALALFFAPILACSSAAEIEGAGGASASATTGAGSSSTSKASSSSSAASSSSSSAVASVSSSATTGSGGSGGATACDGKVLTAGDYDEMIPSGGVMRAFHMHVPASYVPSAATELVLAFHGFTETDTQLEQLSHFDSVADKHGFVVVYPQGLNTSWNAGSCCGTSSLSNVDDVQFTNDLLDHLETELCVDVKRVFSTGFSNGGMFSHRLACELADRIAAIGAVSGTLAVSTCTPSRPVPVLHIHGEDDPVVGYQNGGLSGAQGVPATIATWVMIDGCKDPMPTNEYMMGDVSCNEYLQCAPGTNVELCDVSDGGHQWPGGENDGIGTLTMDLDASEYIAEFFDKHPMP